MLAILSVLQDRNSIYFMTTQHMHVGVIGRILYGVPFIVFGVLHFVNLGGLTSYVPHYVPLAPFWVIVTGIIMILAGLAIVAQKYVRPLTIALAIMLGLFILFVHIPSFSTNLPNLLKDLALLGGALMLLSHYPANNG